MRTVSLLIWCILLSGCVSFQTGLQLAQFGVKVGFDIHDYVEGKKQEVKELASDDR